jgi:hypothetical protein
MSDASAVVCIEEQGTTTIATQWVKTLTQQKKRLVSLEGSQRSFTPDTAISQRFGRLGRFGHRHTPALRPRALLSYAYITRLSRSQRIDGRALRSQTCHGLVKHSPRYRYTHHILPKWQLWNITASRASISGKNSFDVEQRTFSSRNRSCNCNRLIDFTLWPRKGTAIQVSYRYIRSIGSSI